MNDTPARFLNLQTCVYHVPDLDKSQGLVHRGTWRPALFR